MKTVRSSILLAVITWLALTTCALPPVDIGLSVALAAAGQMTLVQSFSLPRNQIQDLEPEAREIRFYPSLLNDFPPNANEPLGYVVIERGNWVSTSLVVLDGDYRPLEVARESASVTRSADVAFELQHTLRDIGTHEKLALFQFQPEQTDFSAIVMVNDVNATTEADVNRIHVPSLSAALAGGGPVHAAGGAAATAVNIDRFTIIEPFGAQQRRRTVRVNTVTGTLDSVVSGAPAEAAAVAPAYGKATVADAVIEGAPATLIYANYVSDNRYRTFVRVIGVPEYTELGIVGRVETVLASDQVLARTRDRFVVTGLFGEPAGSFAAGDLRFAHERQIDGVWHAVFTLTYWGRVDGDDRLFVRVYTVRSDRLSGID